MVAATSSTATKVRKPTVAFEEDSNHGAPNGIDTEAATSNHIHVQQQSLPAESATTSPTESTKDSSSSTKKHQGTFQKFISIVTCQALCRPPSDPYKNKFTQVEDSVHVYLHHQDKQPARSSSNKKTTQHHQQEEQEHGKQARRLEQRRETLDRANKAMQNE